jgi:signal transduction histidine kinase
MAEAQTDAQPSAVAETGRRRRALTAHPGVSMLFALSSDPILVLDRVGRIVLASPAFAGLLPAGVTADGARPGEALGCVHATAGCGSALACAACGLHRIIDDAAGGPVVHETTLPVVRGNAPDRLDLLLRATRIEAGGEVYTTLALADRSASRTRDALDRLFLHDLSDALSALVVWAHLLEVRPADAMSVARQLNTLARRMSAEVSDKRVMLQAETGRLCLQRRPVAASAVLDGVVAAVQAQAQGGGRSLGVEPVEPAFETDTDPTLLVRVLADLARCALDATPRGGQVQVSVRRGLLGCEWRVSDPGLLPEAGLEEPRAGRAGPEDVRRLRVRAVRLLVERGLGGRLHCSSSAGEGTTFSVHLPD